MVKILTANNDPRYFSYDLMVQSAVLLSSRFNPILPFLLYNVAIISHYLWALMLVSKKKIVKDNVAYHNPFRPFVIGFFAMQFILYAGFTFVGIYQFNPELMSVLLQFFAAGKISLDAVSSLFFFTSTEVRGRAGIIMAICFVAGTAISYRVPWNLFKTVNLFKYLAESAVNK